MPIARLRGVSDRLRGLLSLGAAGVLLFLIVEVGYRAMESVEVAAKAGPKNAATKLGLGSISISRSFQPEPACADQRSKSINRTGSSWFTGQTMKLASIAVAILLSSSLSCFAQAEHADKTAKTVLQVMKIEAAWGQAVLRHDAKAFDRILADNYIGTTSNGETRNKTQTLNRLKSAENHFDSFASCDLDLSIDGNKVTVTGHVAAKLKVQDQVRESCFNYTRVYEKRKRRWQVVSSQTNRMTEPCCGPKQ